MSSDPRAANTPSRFFGPPSTSMGRVSVVIFVVGIVLVVLGATVLDSVDTSIGKLNIRGAVTFLVFALALVTCVVALVKAAERSWAVWIAAAVSALLVGFGILSPLIGA